MELKSSDIAPRTLDDATLLSLLRCPVTEQNLVRAPDGSLTTLDRARSYRVVDGVPVVIVPERSLFASDPGVQSTTSRRPLAGRITAACFAAAQRLVPSISRNVAAQENFRELSRLLRADSSDSAKRVLVVGGAVEGAGIDQLFSEPSVTVIETDVVIGPRTQVACDAHDLPFADGSFDAVVCQGVLTNVVDPGRVVAEIHRVLTPEGLVYSETSFLQAVCMGPYDFTRYTHNGHRLLFRKFDELSSGVQCGPGMALAWTFVWFFMALGARSGVARAAARVLVPFFVFWLKDLDPYLVRHPGAYDAASGTFFLGRRRSEAVPVEQIIRGYRGGVKTRWLNERSDPAAESAVA